MVYTSQESESEQERIDMRGTQLRENIEKGDSMEIYVCNGTAHT